MKYENMRYAGIMENDMSAAPGVCVTFFAQGCPHHCKGCHNPETWDFKGGQPFSDTTIQQVISAISANNVQRNLCIMGGEPLCPENIDMINILIYKIRLKYPNIKIYIWTGYTYDELIERVNDEISLDTILNLSDFIIDGKYEESKRDITLKMRGSTNQTIIELKDGRLWKIH